MHAHLRLDSIIIMASKIAASNIFLIDPDRQVAMRIDALILLTLKRKLLTTKDKECYQEILTRTYKLSKFAIIVPLQLITVVKSV